MVTGDGASAFPIVRDGCAGVALPIGGTCQVEVRYTPTEAGVSTATLWIPDATTWHPVPLQANAFGGVTKVELHSAPGDTAGGGNDFAWNPSNASIRASLFEGRLAAIGVGGSGRAPYHKVTLGAKPGDQLAPGAYVANSWSATPSPELDVFLDPRRIRCDDRHGTFVVDELVTWPDGTLRSFGADLDQRCGDSVSGMTGTVAYRLGDTTPAAPWEPTGTSV